MSASASHPDLLGGWDSWAEAPAPAPATEGTALPLLHVAKMQPCPPPRPPCRCAQHPAPSTCSLLVSCGRVGLGLWPTPHHGVSAWFLGPAAAVPLEGLPRTGGSRAHGLDVCPSSVCGSVLGNWLAGAVGGDPVTRPVARVPSGLPGDGLAHEPRPLVSPKLDGDQDAVPTGVDAAVPLASHSAPELTYVTSLALCFF